ncbi:MAG: DUF4173 domain-containing protein [Chloroflexota bacterium]
MDRTLARRVLAVGLAIGIAAELLLDRSAYGVNVPILVGLILGAGCMVRRRGVALDPLDAWLPITSIVIALLVAVRGDPLLAVLNSSVALAFAGAALVAMSGTPVTRRSASVVTTMAVHAAVAASVGVVSVLRAVRPVTGTRTQALPGRLAPVGRGLFLAVPLAVIFATLFSSADPIFRQGLSNLLGWQVNLDDLGARMLFALAVAWFVTGMLATAAVGMQHTQVAPPELARSLGAAARTPALALTQSLGVAEALVVLVVVDTVVGLFVGLQVAYLFGGQDTLVAAGLTYSNYARRGFFELVAATALAGIIVVVLEGVVARRSRPYLAALIVLIGLTGVVLASAALRLRLYQDAYGWTELRLYVLTTIVTMGAALILMAALAGLGRMRWLGHGLAGIAVVALIGLNLVAPGAYVAARNVERAIDPSLIAAGGEMRLDPEYLGVLPDDAVPVLVDALPRLPQLDRRAVIRLLLERRDALRTDPAFAGPASWNLGRERARSALDSLR